MKRSFRAYLSFIRSLFAKPNSFSPSAQKPELVLTAWQEAALPLAVNAVTAATENDLRLAHDPRLRPRCL
jgi:hypothetical protein